MFKHFLRWLPAIGALGIALLVFVQPAFAQDAPIDFGRAEDSIKDTVSPLVGLITNILAVLAAIFAMFEGFKAAKGDSKGWFRALALIVVAAVLFAPAWIFTVLGMDQLATELRQWGLD